jgi:hypothetical protein
MSISRSEQHVDAFEKGLTGLRQVLGYLEARATEDAEFAGEATRTRLIVAALSEGDGVEAMRLIEQPLAEHYGGSGWQYVTSLGRELARQLISGH